jgi:hypothetical protein
MRVLNGRLMHCIQMVALSNHTGHRNQFNHPVAISAGFAASDLPDGTV